jgi:hypothetical protein
VFHNTSWFFFFAGFIQLYAGGQQPDQKVTVPSNILQGQFEIVGEKILSQSKGQ